MGPDQLREKIERSQAWGNLGRFAGSLVTVSAVYLGIDAIRTGDVKEMVGTALLAGILMVNHSLTSATALETSVYQAELLAQERPEPPQTTAP